MFGCDTYQSASPRLNVLTAIQELVCLGRKSGPTMLNKYHINPSIKNDNIIVFFSRSIHSLPFLAFLIAGIVYTIDTTYS